MTDGATVRDQTGKGNDLLVRRLAGSGPDVLTVSADHHAGQPAHASLRFDGGLPDRGAILHTAPDALLNSLRFEDGYTIEMFVKLPEPFLGNHAFMGLFSWEGRSGDAGKHSGWTDLEPTCSLNGIATLGRPFVLGATSFDLTYGQGFYGWIGDVRITARALPPPQFLTPFQPRPR